MSNHDPLPAPILVLGLGNILLGDDGVGPALVEKIRLRYAGNADVECVDGGTQGLALLGRLAARHALIILDALALGRTPGDVSVLEGREIWEQRGARSTTAHEGNAGELLSAAQLLGDLPELLFLVGVQPEQVRTELGLSVAVKIAVPEAIARSCEVIDKLLRELASKVQHA
jgi:hydrogenase maturation protease